MRIRNYLIGEFLSSIRITFSESKDPLDLTYFVRIAFGQRVRLVAARKPWPPSEVPRSIVGTRCFASIARAGDIMLMHPLRTFDPGRANERRGGDRSGRL